MCHPEVPAGAPVPDVRIEEVTIPVEGRAAMPGLLAFPERTPAPGILIVNGLRPHTASAITRASPGGRAGHSARRGPAPRPAPAGGGGARAARPRAARAARRAAGG